MWVKSRHGKRLRLPRSVLRYSNQIRVQVLFLHRSVASLSSPDTVPFCCHFCKHPGFASYTEFITHLVDMHLRFVYCTSTEDNILYSGSNSWGVWTWVGASQAAPSPVARQQAGRLSTISSSTTPLTTTSSRRSCSVRPRQ